MSDEEAKVIICDYDDRIKCNTKIKEDKGCEFCMQIQTRAFLSAMHQNIMALVNMSAPKKVINIGEIGRRIIGGK